MLLAQIGYGRGQKVHDGLSEDFIAGAILSPRDESPDRLESCAAELREQHRSATLFMDPQFHATTVRTPRDGHLPEYDYYASNVGLSRTQFSPRQVRSYVAACLDYQRRSLPGVDYLVSPSILFDDFRDLWSQIALNMAEAAVDHHAAYGDSPPLLVSVVTSEVALRSAAGLSEFLDALSSVEADGFYIIIHRNTSSYQAAMEPVAMGNLMFLVYVLARLNDYRVFVGYSDWLGVLLHAAGATGTASGWHQSLRQFNMARFEPAAGGRRPRKRYSSTPLLSAPLLQPEMEDVYRADRLADVLTGTAYDAIIQRGPATGESRWTDPIACMTHWGALRRAIDPLSSGRIPARLNAMIEVIDRAELLYAQLDRRGVSFEAQTGPGHLDSWRNSISSFRAVSGV